MKTIQIIVLDSKDKEERKVELKFEEGMDLSEIVKFIAEYAERLWKV